MPMVGSVQTVHLSCTDTNTVTKQTKTRFQTTHVTYEFHQVRVKLFVSLWYEPMRQHQHYLQMDRTQDHQNLVT
jgi:hypothetical protein